MKKTLASVLALASFALAGLDDLHGPWNEILVANVHGDRVDYAGVLGEKDKLEAYLGTLAALDSNVVKSASKAERVALYVNAYNAAVVDLIVKNPGAGSAASMGRDLVSSKSFVVAAESLSLGNLQRKPFEVSPDPVFWGLLFDGSLGSAPVLAQAVTSGNVESLAEQNTRTWLADTSRNVLNATTSKVAQIPFDFFRVKPEFRSYSGQVPGFLKKFGPSGCDPEKNRPTYFYNASKNAPIAAAKPEKAKKGGKKKK